MKSALLILVCFFSVKLINSQCIPDPNLFPPNASFDASPDTIDNLPCGLPGFDYETVIHINIPSEIDGTVPGTQIPITVMIDSARVTGVSGLPFGFSNTSNAPVWLGGTVGCLDLQGQTAVEGSYDLSVSISVDYTVDVPFVGTQTGVLDTSFTGYTLIIDQGCSTVGSELLSLVNAQSLFFPNPTSGLIKFNRDVDFISVYDFTGKLIFTRENLKFNEELNLPLNSGVYIVESLKAGKISTYKLVVR